MFRYIKVLCYISRGLLYWLCLLYRLCLFLVDNNTNSSFGQKVKTRCIIQESVNSFFYQKGVEYLVVKTIYFLDVSLSIFIVMLLNLLFLFQGGFMILGKNAYLITAFFHLGWYCWCQWNFQRSCDYGLWTRRYDRYKKLVYFFFFNIVHFCHCYQTIC